MKTQKITFLKAPRPWHKLLTSPPTNTFNQQTFTSLTETYTNIEELYNHLTYHADKGHALLRGSLIKPLVNAPRRRATDAQIPTPYIFLDIDNLSGFESTQESISILLRLLQLDKYGCIIHYSSSARMPKKKGLSAHLILPLEAPVEFSNLNIWANHMCMNEGRLKDLTTMDVGGQVLQTPIDVGSHQPSQVFTLASPVVPETGDDPFLRPEDRFVLIPGPPVPPTVVVDYTLSSYAQDYHELLQTLRADKGFSVQAKRFHKKHMFEEDMEGIYMSVLNPVEASISSCTDQDNFVRINLNGGDSSAYWHPAGEFGHLYSFKGMLRYPMRKILPGYFEENQRSLAAKAASSLENAARGHALETHLYFQEHGDRSTYYAITKTNNPSTWKDVSNYHSKDNFKIRLAKDGSLKLFTQSLLPIPEVRIINHPKKGFLDFNCGKPWINKYTALPINTEPPTDPPTWFTTLVSHVLNGDEQSIERFMSWCVLLVRTYTRPETGWVFHGTQGTGKNLLTSTLGKILGSESITSFGTINKLVQGPFNSSLFNARLVVVDEVQANQFKAAAYDTLNDLVTDETVKINRKFKGEITQTNRMAFILTANQPDVLPLKSNDRRWHVPPRQELPIKDFVFNSSQLADIAGQTQKTEDIVELRTWFMSQPLTDAYKHVDKSEAKEKVITSGNEVIYQLLHVLEGVNQQQWENVFCPMEFPNRDELVASTRVTPQDLFELDLFLYNLYQLHSLLKETGPRSGGYPSKSFGITSKVLEIIYRTTYSPGKSVEGGRKFMASMRHRGYQGTASRMKAFTTLEGDMGMPKLYEVPSLRPKEVNRKDLKAAIRNLKSLGYLNNPSPPKPDTEQ